jgi:PhnB protein
MKIQSYLHFNGQCAEAFAFYEKALGGKISFAMTYGDSPMKDETPPELLGKIMHTSLDVGDQRLMGCDAPPHMYEKPQGYRISIGVDTPEEADRVFTALAAGGDIKMPIQETFWARRFGMVDDKYGMPWMVNCEKPM